MALRVAVIGASGFVGRALVQRLSNSDETVVSALTRPTFDLLRPDTFHAIDDSVDVVVHAAGAVGADRPDAEHWAANVVATHHLVSFLNDRPNPPYLMYLSTGAVNGNSDGRFRATEPMRPTGTYALTKYLAEEVIRKSYRGSSSIPRLYFPYGPGQQSNRLIPTLVRRVIRGEPIKLNRDGRPLLSLVYIADLVAFLEQLLRVSASGDINVAGATCMTIQGIVATIERSLGKAAIRQNTGEDVLDFCAENIIGGKQTSIEDGIRDVCDFERKLIA